MANSSKRHELRKQLLANGYRPLPLVDKGIRIPGWTRDEINLEWIEQYRRSGAYPNTGIRCDDLIAFDIDVTDEDLADEIEELIEATVGPTDLCRVGCWPKRLLLYRASVPAERSARSGKYGGHQVELLATHGRQFAAFGVHPGTQEEYEWLDGHSPLTVPYSQLPPLSPDGAMQCLNAIDDYLAATGLEKTSPGGRRGVEGVNLYDLTDDLPLSLTDGSETTWGELKGQLDQRGVWGNLKRENGEWGDSDGVHFYVAAGLGEPCIHDFARDVTHWDRPATERLAETLPEPPAAAGLFGQEALADLLENYVLLGDKTVRHVDHPEHSYALDAFKALKSNKTVLSPATGQPVQAVNEWLKHDETLRADKAALRPDWPDDLIVRDGKLDVFNTYNPPRHPEVGGEVETLLEFTSHLFPDDAERDLFLDWIALKVANPGYRMHAMLTVTRTQGTGRGTWAQILQKLFGLDYVNSVELPDLVGSGSQAQFNEYLATSLIVYVPEALEEKEDRSKWQSRHLAYERLKLVCEMTPTRAHIKRKYGRNSTEWVYASLLISSNHLDALAIEPGDRRVIVLENTDIKLVDAGGDLFRRIHAWHAERANIGAAARYFKGRAASAQYDPFGDAPPTPAKARMIEAGQSDVSRLFDLYVEQAAGDICTAAQWRAFAYQARLSGEYDLPPVDKLDAAITAVLQSRARRALSTESGNLKIKKAVVRPWIIRNFSRWSKAGKGSTVAGLNSAIRAEILKNGEPGGAVHVLQKPEKDS